VVNIVLPAIVCLLILTACIYLVSKCKSRGTISSRTCLIAKRAYILSVTVSIDIVDFTIRRPTKQGKNEKTCHSTVEHYS
jgi:hypothetical protein